MIRVGDAFVYMSKHKYYAIKVADNMVWLSVSKDTTVSPGIRADWDLRTAQRVATGHETTRENWQYIPAYPSHVQLPPGV